MTDLEVAVAVRFALEELHMLVEPGGAVALAALLAGHLSMGGRDSVIVLSGGNVDLPMLANCLKSAAAVAA